MRLVGFASVAALVGLVVLAGCTTSPPAPAATSGAQPTPTSSTGLGPLDALLGAIDGRAPDAAAQFVAQQAERENRIAACMKEQGFEYVPQVPDVADITVVTEGIDPASREYAQQYGFGLANQPEQQVGMVSWSAPPGWRDENGSLRQLMSPAEREAYDTALQGPVVSRQVDAAGNESVARDGGCASGGGAGGVAVVTEARQYLVGLYQDGAFDQLDLEWSTCMRDAGFDFESPEQARRSFSERLGEQLVKPDGTLDVAARDAVGREELEVAPAAWDCRQAADYDERHRTIEFALQQQWVDEHRAELDAWVAQYGAAQ